MAFVFLGQPSGTRNALKTTGVSGFPWQEEMSEAGFPFRRACFVQ